MTLPAVGDILAGKYKIVKLLGKGGMGVVFLAKHEILRQHVAIKMVLPEVALDPVFVARFMNEARAAAGIRNEHVAQVLDVASLESGAPYMVLEYLEGHDLSDVLTDTEGDLAIETSVDWLLEALEAVAQAHQLGIIHRDLKPANLFLSTRQDGSRVIKVLDFGISKATNPGDVNDVAVTSTQALLGSPGYMAPEQIRSSKSVDARADVWSVGVILYKLLTKVEPFVGDSFGALFGAIFSEDPVRIRDRRPEVPVALEDVVFRCLARERDQRYPNVADLARALAPFASLEGRASVERVCRTLGVSASAPVAPAPPPTSGSSSPSGPEFSQLPKLAAITGASNDRASVSPLSESMGDVGMGRAASGPPPSQVHTVMDASLSAGLSSEAQPPKAKGRATLVIGAAVVFVAVAGAAVVAAGGIGKRATGTDGVGMVASSDVRTSGSAPLPLPSPSASAAGTLPSAELAATPRPTAATVGSASASTSASAMAATPKPAGAGGVRPAVPTTAPGLRPTTAAVTSAKAVPSAKPKPPDDSVLGGGRN
jgi:serine/threonine protein kinase